MAYDEDVKKEAIRLRVEEQKSLKDIAISLGISKGTASAWLRGCPLPQEILRDRAVGNGKASRGRHKVRKPPQVREVTARFKTIIEAHKYTTQQLGSISETAVLFRLQLHQFDVFMPASDGSRIDWLVVDPATGRSFKVQVKTVSTTKPGHGLPRVSLRCAVGTKNGNGPGKYRRYTDAEFDFIIGYDLMEDVCYVWSFEEIGHLSSGITIRHEAAERWDKLRGVAQSGSVPARDAGGRGFKSHHPDH